MKSIVVSILVALTFVCAKSSPLPAAEESDDPCGKQSSNAEMSQCYSKAQGRINAKADSTANEIVAKFRKDAQDPAWGSVVGGQLRKAASALAESQRTWKTYRDQHCHAVMYSWTTGSGAGTAYEICLFSLGKARVQELRSDFNLN